MPDIEFHLSDMCICQGDKYCQLATPEGVVFHNLWANRGKWLKVRDLLISMNGTPVPSNDPSTLIKVHISNIRRKLREAGIEEVVIENQRQSFWADTAYRIVEDTP